MAGKQQQQRTKPSLLEWIAGAVGLAVTAGLLVFLGLEAADPASERPPVLDVRPIAITKTAVGHILEVEVSNGSGKTAASVHIEGELTGAGPDGGAETSNAVVDYMPGHSQRRAGLIFSGDPRTGQLKLRATGYQKP